MKKNPPVGTGQVYQRTRKRLSELEGCVLGLVWLLGPCTTYAVRRTFVQSPSSQWSGSAGAIYPLVRRLARQGLLRSKSSSTGSRASRRYEITAEGRKKLIAWLGPPFGENVTGIPPDPIRTRLAFLEALSHPEMHRFLSVAEESLQGQIKRAERECQDNRRNEHVIDYFISRGALLTAEARLAWIREVRAALESDSGK